MSCNSNCSPCSPCESVSASNEPLPSALQNLVEAFFGSITKTVVNGQVIWTLPCEMEQGLPANPRLEGEGVGCYLLRLIEDGIVGLTGETGEQGPPGQDGKSGYTFVAFDFATPTEECGTVQIEVDDGASILIGAYVFVEATGWFEVVAKTGNQVGIKLIELLTGAPATVPAGSFVLVSGPRGPVGSKGSKGDAGEKGDDGDPGTPGATGATGASASTTTTGGYTQPAVGSTVTVGVVDSSFFVSGQQVYVVGGGYYEVSSLGAGSLTLRNLTAAATNVAPTTAVSSGAKVSTAGYGPIAPVGDAVGSGTDYAITGAMAAVVFGTDQIDALLPMAGTYIVAFDVQLVSGSPTSDPVTLKLRDVTAGADITGTTRVVSLPNATTRAPVHLEAVITVAAATTVQVWAERDAVGTADVISTRSSSRWIRVAPVA